MGSVACSYDHKHCCQVDLSHETNVNAVSAATAAVAVNEHDNNKSNDNNNQQQQQHTPKQLYKVLHNKQLNSYKSTLMDENTRIENLKQKSNVLFSYQDKNFKRFTPNSQKQTYTSDNNDIMSSSYSIYNTKGKRAVVNTQTLLIQRQGFKGEKKQLKILKMNNNSKENFDMIKKCFNKHFFLSSFDIKTQIKMIKEMICTSIEQGQIISLEGTPSELFYVIKSGQIEVSKNNDYEYLRNGDSFGETALINNELRTETIKALCNCEFWVLEKDTFMKYLKIETHSNVQVNLQFVKKIKVFSFLDNHQQLLIAGSLQKHFYLPNQFIVKQYDDADGVFVIAEGVVSCCTKGKEICALKQGDIFGERSAMLDSKRTLDVVAKTKCICFKISNSDLSQVLGKNYRSELFFQFVKHCFAMSEPFKDIEMNLILSVIDLFTVRTHSKGEVVFKKGNRKSEKVSVMIDGALYNESDINTKNQPVAKGTTLLFSNALYSNSKEVFKDNIIADPDCLLFEADANEIEDKLNVSFKEMVGQSRNCKLLKEISFLMDIFTLSQIEALSVNLNYKTYCRKDKIYLKDDDALNMFVLKKGIVLLNGNELQQGNVFGVNTLSNEDKYNENAYAYTDCECLFISKNKIIDLIGENYYNYVKSIFNHKINAITKTLKDFDYYYDLPSPNKNNFISVVSHKYDSKLHYTIKCIPKYLLFKHNLYNSIEMRDKILTTVNNPFILKYFKSFSEKNCVFCLKEFITSVHISSLINNHHLIVETISPNQIKAYMATLLIACSFLHKKRIVYRNISPEGVVIRDNGFLCLINFDYSKCLVVNNKQNNYTNTKVGLPHYMSPEAITGEKYSFDVDYWSIAVFVYQIAFGELPFGKVNSEPMSVYFDIINKEVTFPCKQDTAKINATCFQNFQYLMRSMLRKNRLLRLARFEDIKRHDWFEEFNWEELEELKTVPEYIPETSSNISLKNTSGAYLKHFFETTKDVNSVCLYETLTEKEKKGIDEWYKTF